METNNNQNNTQEPIKVSIVGASGYTGGELLRLLLMHPKVKVMQATSERNAKKLIKTVHPNLRHLRPIKFTSINDLVACDLLFLCLPHKTTMEKISQLKQLAPKIIDLSGDFRLKTKEDYQKWYEHEHTNPELLNQFVYGIPELHKEDMKNANYISSAGCNATCTILGLYPLIKAGVIDLKLPIIAESKCGSSEGGNKFSLASHHPERTGCVRSYKPTRHRHTAEMLQELSIPIDNPNNAPEDNGAEQKPNIHFSATSIQMIRGILTTSHVFLKPELNLTELDIWKIYRSTYKDQPFIRFVNDRSGIYRMPEPKILTATNFCDIGFQKDPQSNRLVVISAIDNLMKGAAGQAVQGMNIMMNFEETLGLEFPGLHPI
ncbi:N-acetyl-gamma-glutamyl-phosphate reductase [archaeon]|jgi:LysW-gamma-L-alpha-aminoadipyl-6-phosphate/LysW-L-glutamyl-5-phosphate reductase|nr:N-acetyl-gamma-glutamyl-phosphate reductase [archaeon]MBT6698698.1 N-acetyl-gamma-glutamyl-phosphate reductase [archaeon]